MLQPAGSDDRPMSSDEVGSSSPRSNRGAPTPEGMFSGRSTSAKEGSSDDDRRSGKGGAVKKSGEGRKASLVKIQMMPPGAPASEKDLKRVSGPMGSAKVQAMRGKLPGSKNAPAAATSSSSSSDSDSFNSDDSIELYESAGADNPLAKKMA